MTNNLSTPTKKITTPIKNIENTQIKKKNNLNTPNKHNSHFNSNFTTPMLNKKNYSFLNSIINSISMDKNNQENISPYEINFKNFTKKETLLFQSQASNFDHSLNLNDKFYLKKLTNYFSTPPFPIKYSNHTKKFFYDIYSNNCLFYISIFSILYNSCFSF